MKECPVYYNKISISWFILHICTYKMYVYCETECITNDFLENFVVHITCISIQNVCVLGTMTFSKVISAVIGHRKCGRAMTFENFMFQLHIFFIFHI